MAEVVSGDSKLAGMALLGTFTALSLQPPRLLHLPARSTRLHRWIGPRLTLTHGQINLLLKIRGVFAHDRGEANWTLVSCRVLLSRNCNLVPI